ncbi:hypothetical protein [Planctopirus hydrillae]|uniref:Uncharacterized protein n=1 Tax=Planctopirus hydrillae TaxID=1841610 RepID=A0A1C3ETY0_9PLAN|nr:hypothetical protein [Planctopirus hydrillae]ODA36716.1 hypothetical protein A6X21_15335 [Planctopirus hydrillae]
MAAISETEIHVELRNAEAALATLGERETRLWERVKITPTQWRHNQYPNVGPVWVVAVMGKRCLYYNAVEGGWGWGRFESWGIVADYHWQQDEIQHAIHFLLFAIDNGGMG